MGSFVEGFRICHKQFCFCRVQFPQRRRHGFRLMGRSFCTGCEMVGTDHREEEWRHLCSVSGIRMRSVDIPVRPMRCDHLRLRIEGSGEAKIYSITKTIEEGSDGP